MGVPWSTPADDPTGRPAAEAFRAALRDSGDTEGRNIVLELRYAAGRLDRFPAPVVELVHANVDVIPASSPLSIRAAREATTSIPIVMVNGDPAMFPNLSRPGGSVTGLIAFQAELAGKQMELLKEAVPQLSRPGDRQIPRFGAPQGVAASAGREARCRTLAINDRHLDRRATNV